jgi:molecular chaperone GrpE
MNKEIKNENKLEDENEIRPNETNGEGAETVKEAEVLEDQEFEGIDEGEIISLEGLVDELKSSNNKLIDENKKLENELNAAKDRLVRMSAEYDNFRKRTAKEKEGSYSDACEDVLKYIFPVLDNLERAASVQGSVEDIKKGIEMTLRQFKDSLEKLQIEEIPTSEGFDPNLHNAVMHIDDDSFGKNEVVEVFQKGYKRGSKILRHSMVKVAN